MQAQNISTIVVGPVMNTVICLDIGLYRPAKKLQMARKYIDLARAKSEAPINNL